MRNCPHVAFCRGPDGYAILDYAEGSVILGTHYLILGSHYLIALPAAMVYTFTHGTHTPHSGGPESPHASPLPGLAGICHNYCSNRILSEVLTGRRQAASRSTGRENQCQRDPLAP